MLKILRKKGVMKKLLWGIAIVIIISFGFFGSASILNRTERKTFAGKIFGRKISSQEYEEAYRQTSVKALMQYGESFFKIREFLDLEAQTWDRLILLYEARKRKIQVSDEELIAEIERYPFFQRDGQFDTALYNNIVRSLFKMKTRQFEEGVRETLKITKLFNQVTFPVSVSDDQVLEDYKMTNEQVQVDYVLIPTEKFKDQVAVDEGQVKKYFEENKRGFLIPPTTNVEYITLEYSDAMADDVKNELFDKASDIYEKLLSTPDLDKIAQEYDLAVNTTGPFSREEPNLQIGWSYELMELAFALKQGEISEPLETPKGIYILEIKEKKDSHMPEFIEVADKVKDVFVSQQASRLAKTKAEEYLAALQTEWASGNTDFEQAVSSLGLSMERSPTFKRGGYLPTIGISEDFQRQAFALNADNPLSSDVVAVPTGYCILHLNTYVPIDQEEFEKQKEDLSAKVLVRLKNKAFTEFLTKLRLKADLKNNLQMPDEK